MKIKEIRMKHADTVLAFIYFFLVDDGDAARARLEQCDGPVREALPELARRFESELGRAYGVGTVERWRGRYRDAALPGAGPESDDGIDLQAAAECQRAGLSEGALNRLARFSGAALDFLFAFNVRRRIIPELLPRLPESEAAYEISRTIRERTAAREGLVLLAASTAPEALPAGYILKDWKFQDYSFSIFREGADRFSFEFVSRRESLKGKLIHVSIIPPEGEPVIIEESCAIHTNQYALSYAGDLPRGADINPAIIAMK